MGRNGAAAVTPHSPDPSVRGVIIPWPTDRRPILLRRPPVAVRTIWRGDDSLPPNVLLFPRQSAAPVQWAFPDPDPAA